MKSFPTAGVIFKWWYWPVVVLISPWLLYMGWQMQRADRKWKEHLRKVGVK